METTQAQQDFVRLFMAYMARAEAYKPLSGFIKTQRINDLRDCLSIYFTIPTEEYDEKGGRSLRIFYELSSKILVDGDVYFALRFEALVNRDGTPEHERYVALDSTPRNVLARQIKRQKAALSVTQKLFLRIFDRYMKQPSKQEEAKLTDWTLSLRFGPLYDCLLAYIEVSQRFPDDDQNSLKVFYGLSLRALGLGTTDFAARYESCVHSGGTVWKRRYDALEPWQRSRYLEPAIKEKKQIAIETEYSRKGQGVTKVTEKYTVPTVPPVDADPEDKHQTSPETNTQREFVKKFREFMDSRDKKHTVSSFTEYLFSLSFEQLRECVQAYLKASTKYADNDEWSLYIFFGTASRAISKGDAYYAFKFNHNIQSAGLLARRYAALHPCQQKELSKDIKDKQKRARVLDDLKFAYFQKNLKDPDLWSLRTFEIPISEEQALMLSKALDKCNRGFASHRVEVFTDGFDELSALLKAQRDPLLFVTLLKRCREAQGLTRIVHHQLYWYMVGALYIRVLTDHPEVYKRGFSKEEKQFLFDDADSGDPYFHDFGLRLDYLWMRYQSHTEFTQLSEAFCMLLLVASNMGARLVSLEENAAVRGLVEKARKEKPDEFYSIRIPIPSRYNRGNTLRISQTIAGRYFIVWWHESRGEAYIEVNGFESILFGVDLWWLGRVNDDDTVFGEVYRSTQHIMYLWRRAFEEFLQVLPDLLLGGFSGAIESIAFSVVVDSAANALGVDSSEAQLVLLGASLLAHGVVSGKKGSAVSALETQSAEIERRAAGQFTGGRSVQNRLTDEQVSEFDVRSIRTEEDEILIRGEETGLSSGSSGTAIRQTGTPMVSTDGVANKGVSSRSIPGTAASRATRQDLALAEEHLKDVQRRFEKAQLTMGQKQKQLGDREDKLKEALGKRGEPQQRAALESATLAERNAVQEYRRVGWDLEAARRRVERLRNDLAKSTELSRAAAGKPLIRAFSAAELDAIITKTPDIKKIRELAESMDSSTRGSLFERWGNRYIFKRKNKVRIYKAQNAHLEEVDGGLFVDVYREIDHYNEVTGEIWDTKMYGKDSTLDSNQLHDYRIMVEAGKIQAADGRMLPINDVNFLFSDIEAARSNASLIKVEGGGSVWYIDDGGKPRLLR